MSPYDAFGRCGTISGARHAASASMPLADGCSASKPSYIHEIYNAFGRCGVISGARHAASASMPLADGCSASGMRALMMRRASGSLFTCCAPRPVGVKGLRPTANMTSFSHVLVLSAVMLVGRDNAGPAIHAQVYAWYINARRPPSGCMRAEQVGQP